MGYISSENENTCIMKKLNTLGLAAILGFAIAAPFNEIKAQSRNVDVPEAVYQTRDIEKPNKEPRYGLHDEDISFKEITIYPNPANDFINVDFGSQDEGRRKIDIYDLQGNNVFHLEEQESGGTLSIKQLKPGLYILVAGNQTFKLQKI